MKLALAQMLVEGGRPVANLQRAVDRIATASAEGADCVLLPEALDCGWTHPCARDSAEPIPNGAACEKLCEAAKEHQVWLCAGLIERDAADLYNAAILCDPNGEVRLHHRKIHELDIATDLYRTGGSAGVCKTEFGVIGLQICADGFSPQQWISRELGKQGARIILSPCAWAVDANHDPNAEPYGAIWRENYGPVAREYSLWIAGCSNVGPLDAGPWAGRQCIGNSIVFDSNGEEVLTGPYGTDADHLLYVEIPKL